MKTISRLFLPIFFAVVPNLCAQEYRNVDSLILEFNRRANDTVKVRLASLICQNLTYTNPSEAYKYAHKMVSISEDIQYENGIALGYNNLGYYFFNRDELDSALYYRKATLDLVTRLQNIGGILTSNMQFAVLYNKMNDFETAKSYLNRNISLFENRDTLANAREEDFKYIGSTYHQLADIQLREGLYNLALQNQLRALELYKERAEDPLFEADAYMALGQTEMKLENYRESLSYFEQAYQVYHDFNDLLWESDVLRNMGENLILQNRPEKALEHLRDAIAISQENNFQGTEASGHNLSGDAYIKLKDYGKARQSLNAAVEVYRQMDNPTEINKAYLSLGILYNALNQPQQALSNLEQALVISDSIKALPQTAEAYFQKFQAYRKAGEFQLALDNFEAYNGLNDSIFNIRKSQQIEELRIMHQTEQNEAEIALQQEEIKTLNARARADNLTKGLYAGGMASALALSGLLVFGFRQRIKKNRIAREKQEAIYRQEIAHKKKELASQTLHLVQKKTFIQELMENLESIKRSPNTFKTEFRRIVMLLRKENASDKDWEVFKTYFAEVHNDFDQKLKTLSSDISEKEIRLAAFLRMNLTTKEIAATMNVLPGSILKSKYRLKKKLGLEKDMDLGSFLNTL